MRSGLAAGVIAALAVAATASAAPARDTLVRPGVGIGRVALGMTQAQVERVLGKPTLVNRRYRLGFGRIYVEHDWDYARWTVGYEGRPGRLRVVLVGTTIKTQRTAAGVGVDSRARDIVRAYPSARCLTRWRGVVRVGRFVRVPAGGSRWTVFFLRDPWFEDPSAVKRVIEVSVASTARLPGEQSQPCPPDWRRG